MTDQAQNNGSTGYFFAGLLIGGLAGAAASILMAPQSGKETRDQIQAKGVMLRNDANDTVQKTVAQVRQISDDMHEKAGELQQRGKDMINEQRENLSTLVSGENNGVKLT
jgi:gas vesicle protein